MHWPGAGSYFQPVGSLEGGTNIIFGFAHSVGKRKILGETGGDRRRQRAAGTMAVARLNTRRGKSGAGAALDQKIGAFRSAAVTALDQHRAGTQRKQLLRLVIHRLFIARLILTGKSGRLWQVGCDQDRKSTRLNSSHGYISYAVFCLKKKKNESDYRPHENRSYTASDRPL